MLNGYEDSPKIGEPGNPSLMTPEAQAKLGQMSLMPVASLDNSPQLEQQTSAPQQS